MNDKPLDQIDAPADNGSPAVTLAAEHAVLLHEVRRRCVAATDDVDVDADQWPTPALRRLLDYLYVEVLQQVADEEWRLFRDWGHAPEQLAKLRAEHLRVREAVEALTDAAVQPEPCAAGHLRDLVAELLAMLREHFADEQTVLESEMQSAPPSTAALGSTPHEWYPLAEGPVIDLDDLPGPNGARVITARLLRLRPGEKVELDGTADPHPILQNLATTHPGGYLVTVLQQAPNRWRVEVLCRSAA